MSPRVRKIIADIATENGVTVDEIMGRSKLKAPRTARKAAYRALRSLHTKREDAFTYAAIGRLFGRDHTTIVWACQS